MSRRELSAHLQGGRVDVDHVSIELGRGADAFEAVADVNFAIDAGEFVCVLGPSGCGKSTLLGAIAGHIQITKGQLEVDNEEVRGPHPDRGIVFQHHTLFPWKSARDNVAFGPKMRGVAKAERRRLAMEMLDLVGLVDFADRYPKQLSGGMQQRVEIARVLVNKPRLLLMDEPFGALDALTRLMMQELLLAIWRRVPTTIVFVTHDIDEALFLADRIIVMSPRPGRILEVIEVPFGRPRPTEIMASMEFGRLKAHCLSLLRPRDDTPALQRLSPLGLAFGEGR
ncbi:ABC transporter ATP-binding protein [Hyphomicrobium sp. MC1]|uniref:ABC transporter ATP-binding protein n=1 Tax=Hyphomicrobium sp. (strain MC1) TaxID=717785 RepID=UPI000213EB7A|nr:ABC transporter ATP-binding protein [Hyphomicrobium sp. MC1]CCB66629.1 ATP-binding component of ABC superfamily; putative alkanesulfonate transporter subunit [Hyphomicrobium sp. MC1]